MTFQRVPDTAQIEMIYSWQGQRVENVYHVNNAVPPSTADLGTLITTFINWHATHQKNAMHPSIALVLVIARSLDSEGAPAVEAGLGAGVAGISTGTALPNNCALAIKWTTALSGRSFRGRTYHMGLLQEQTATGDPNHLNSSAITGLVSVYQALLTAINISTQNLCVVSRRHAHVVRTEAVTTPITGLAVNSTLDSQRRRLPERGS